jgi:hypothetical protein
MGNNSPQEEHFISTVIVALTFESEAASDGCIQGRFL